jgi:hypothetical protein
MDLLDQAFYRNSLREDQLFGGADGLEPTAMVANWLLTKNLGHCLFESIAAQNHQ